MSVNTSLSGISQTASSNGPDGATDAPSTLDDAIRYALSFTAQLRDGKGFTAPATLASASTTDIGAQNSLAVEISGTTTITSFGTTYNGPRFLRFTGALTLTHASALNLPGAANITTAAGDTCIAYPNSAGNGWNVTQYQQASGLPGMVLLSTKTASASATIDFTGIDGTFTNYKIILTDYTPSTNNADLTIRLSQSAAFNSGANYTSAAPFAQNSSATGVLAVTAGTAFLVMSTTTNAAGDSLSGEFLLLNPAGAVVKKMTQWQVLRNNAGAITAATGGGVFTLNTTAIDGIRFLASSGNIATGTFKLYGIR
jgi:hypothetical protein